MSHVQHLLELHPRADLAGEGEVVAEPLEVDAEGVGQLRDLAVLKTVPQLLALVAAVEGGQGGGAGQGGEKLEELVREARSWWW